MSEQLSYEIHKYSSYSTSYLPENIREDCPSNQTSRWSSNTNSPPQFLTLKLQRPAIVKTIKFGKYEKTHVCNLRKFKIFGGLEEEHMVLLFEGGLKNDNVPEIFTLRHTTDSGELLPVLFIQIMPLLSWGPSFNFSIWYVELQGQDDPIFVRTSLQNYNTLREVEIVRLCLKHFRQQGYEAAFRCLQDQTNVLLEHPMMSNLHDALVIRGDFKETEDFMEQCVDDGLLDAYLSRQDYKASWELQDVAETENRPGMRGGHQLVIDNQNGLIYLYAGWDGFEDLSDLWCYSIKSNVWRLIHANSEKFDGPTPRSCHKMVFDPRSGQIFILGRYLDGSSRTKEHIKSEFYLYDTSHQTWLQICDDTSQVGGPQLIFDHQMCIDVDKQTIYVFGGRILTPRNIDDMSNDPQYSGLFSYHIGTNMWTQLLVDCGHPSAAHFDVPSIKSRVTHSMVFHHRHRKLYIFGGQRNKEYITDFVAYDVDAGELSVLNLDATATAEKNVPQSGFTQRATIDCDRDEIYVLSSLSKEKERRDFNVNSLWLYSLKLNEWTCIYKCDHSTENCCSNKGQVVCSEPCPRYAHQLVFDATNRIHYLFGGNPGRNTLPQLRLDDFWVLRLEKPSRQQILRHCKYLIRRLEYEEITKSDPLKAVNYLQTRLHDIIDHKDPEELKEFHKLASLLFKCDDFQTENSSPLMTVPLGTTSAFLSDKCASPSGTSTAATPSPSSASSSSSSSAKVDMSFNVKNQRYLLFNKLVKLLPENMVQPKGNLSDFVLI
ncbi:muskelin [Phlebotomus papatasi]|uniref:muskelin n=1 Tax=Phlebotomus papatasi TaxID=29031 RepID=UPI002483D09E|nr:muskelin [Phlebotomus papatasi]